MKNYILIVVLISSLFFSCKSLKHAKDPRLTVQTAVTDAIHLMESKDFEFFLNTYVYPEDLKKILKKRDMKSFVADFANEKYTTLLSVLKSIKGKKPDYSENSTVATFDKTKFGLNRTFVFKKDGEFWYIKN